MQEFTYRPAALRGERKLVVTETGFQHAEGPERRWVDLTGAELQAQNVRGVEFVTLRLEFGPEVEMMSWSGVGPQLADFFAILREVLRAVAHVHPDLQVRFGPSGGYRVLAIVVALLFAAVGIFLTGIAVVMAADGDWGAALAMGPVGLIAGIGGAMMVAGQRPGQKQQTRSISETIEMMAEIPEIR